MSLREILSDVRTFEGVLELAPTPGSEHPEISWGDHYFYYAPDGLVPRTRQPYATIVTKDYPGDTLSKLDPDERWRLNIHVGTEVFVDLLGYRPSEIDESAPDHSAADVFTPHPLYGAQGWVCVVNPGPRTLERARELLRGAHLADRRRVERRSGRHRDKTDERRN